MGNRLLSKGMSNICLNVTIEKNWQFQNFDLLSLKNLLPGQFSGSSNSPNFKTSCCNLKPEVWGQNYQWLFCYFNFASSYDVLKSKRPRTLLKKNINFNKNETESKMENPGHSFRDTDLVLQLM